jgi:hypothetical protein
VNTRTIVIVCLLALFVTSVVASKATAQGMQRPPDFSDKVDTIFTRASEERNRQKFYSILIFVVLGGAVSYVTFRGIKKVVSID